MKQFFFILAVTATTIGCNNQTKPDKQTSDTFALAQKEKQDSIKKEQADSIAKVSDAQRVDNIKNLDALKKKFKYNEDEFNKIGWYTHKNQTVDNSWGRKYLKTHVKSDGYIYLEDQYYAEDWLFHTRIEVKIGDNVYKSEDIPTYSNNNKTENSGGSIWENVSYTAGQDNGIIKAIAENADKKIKVRFIGKEYYSDFTLSPKDKEAIKEGYQLSELIKKLVIE